MLVKKRRSTITREYGKKESTGQSKPLFLLSFDHRDPLSQQLAEHGWQVTSARRADDLRARFLSCGALIAVIDVRGHSERGAAAIEALTEYSEDYGVSILAIGDSKEDKVSAKLCYDAGATHFHDITSNPDGIEQALLYAYRFSERLRGGADNLSSLNAIISAGNVKWRICKTGILRSEIDQDVWRGFDIRADESYPLSALYRPLNAADRKRFQSVWRDLKAGRSHTAFAHKIADRKIIHHIRQDDIWIEGRLEFPDSDAGSVGWTNRDALSGLRNGASARNWVRKQAENGSDIGVAIFGVRNFATINAAYGRAVGDELMRIIGQRMIAAFSGDDMKTHIIARMDGQNFIFAASLADENTEFSEKVKSLLNTAFLPAQINGRSVQIVARAGIAQASGPFEETVLIRRASLVLAEAMMSDNIQMKAWQQTETDILLEQELERDLANALSHKEIKIALQPQIKLSTGQLIGAEALARWQHPRFGFLGAATLFSVAERAGMMDLLSAHIHDAALHTASLWPESLEFLRLSINITAGDLSRSDFAEKMLEKVAASRVPANRITLEITESDLIADISNAVNILNDLRKAGIAIALDDFGTGYSSLSYLKDLPLDYLKIDSGLTGDIGGSQKDQVVVRSIIDMAKSLDLKVIAEGVETEGQLIKLAELDCDYFQGFLRSGPLNPEEFELFALRSN